MLELDLPYPPSVNTYWRHVPKEKRVMVLLSKKGRDYRDDVAQTILMATRGAVKFKGPVCIDAIAYPPDRRERDLDNLPKSVFDALQKTRILERDSQISDFRFRRGPVVKGGHLKLRIASATVAITEGFDDEHSEPARDTA